MERQTGKYTAYWKKKARKNPAIKANICANVLKTVTDELLAAQCRLNWELKTPRGPSLRENPLTVLPPRTLPGYSH